MPLAARSREHNNDGGGANQRWTSQSHSTLVRLGSAAQILFVCFGQSRSDCVTGKLDRERPDRSFLTGTSLPFGSDDRAKWASICEQTILTAQIETRSRQRKGPEMSAQWNGTLAARWRAPRRLSHSSCLVLELKISFRHLARASDPINRIDCRDSSSRADIDDDQRQKQRPVS